MMMIGQFSHRASSIRCAVAGALACLVGSGFAAGAQAGATSFGSWEYAVDRLAEGRSEAVYARTRSDDGAYLWLACTKVVDEGRPPVISMTATVAQRQYLGKSDPRGRSTVYWFDDGGPEVSNWTYRDHYGQMSGREPVKGFLEKLMEAETLVVELSDYRLNRRASKFKLNREDTQSIADRFRKDCATLSGT
jgi:hypothetical protein